MKWTYREVFMLRKYYSVSDRDKIQNLIPNRSLSAIKQKANKLGLKKDDFITNKSRWKKGKLPWNTGTKGKLKKNKTTFRKGHQSNSSPIGTRSIRNDSGRLYCYIKIESKKWEREHVLRWVEKYGAIPKGHFLVCKTPNTLNTDPDNWELVNRAENAKRNQNREKQRQKWEYKRIKNAYAMR